MAKILPFSLTVLSLALLSACSDKAPTQTVTQNEQTAVVASSAQQVVAPIAKKVPFEMEVHGDKRIDDYYWMRDDKRENPEILAHLEAENNYTNAQLAHTEKLQADLFEELKARIKKNDDSVPVKKGQYFYSTEMRGDNEYPIYVRSSDVKGSNKEVLLDVNELAKDHAYYQISGLDVSPSGQLMAYGEDKVSRRVYTLRFQDLTSKAMLPDVLEGTEGDVVWANDNKTVYYIKKDPQTLLGYQVFRHTLGTAQSEDQLVYEETDNSYYTGIGKSKDGSVIYISHGSTESSGISVIDANNPKAMPQRLIPREKGLEYEASKLGDYYYITTNWDAVNFRLMKVHQDQLGDKANWQEVIPHRADIKLEGITLFNNHLVYQEREKGQTSIKVRDLTTQKEQSLSFNDPVFATYMYGNSELDNPSLRVYYTSLTTPGTHYDIDLVNGEKNQLKQQEVLGDFNADNYASERIFIKARDGVEVPVSLVYRKDKFKQDGTNPLYQYGYGSYGATMEPRFSSTRLSLLDRGFVYAIAHIRGSQMLGRPWYDDGKKLTKQNTFNDFIDVTKALTSQGYASKDQVFAVGGSAGGLLMGAVINQAPELYKGVAAHVPFVDVVTTMLDESIPLTTNEYDEWGNPNDKTYYDYMLSYSPYDQVKKQAYPNLLVTTGLHDSQVQYFEPAKWVAKLREHKTDNNKLLFKVDMEAGHGGASGRFKGLKDSALEYAFILDLAGKNTL
ncbi:oligopeptidase B [Pseudoalteromonas ulvae UL12]|uniref:Oligopeptidase B n=1 Tax=Pseudoalteromonas ulvae TaxID=107327 RepID=A0A2D0A0D4_PSEDV|nr:S9 family peptidase [Pseudoalteromonas ulvae]MBE0364733.1 oligopeptidase B [Pseudoalteromonas ulvae UL12]OUL56135.1 oligopeptidase B [Pseudoalteromonas ulvae]